jgi:hypothetical protein
MDEQRRMQMDEQEADIIELEHAVLSPLIDVMKFVKAVFALLMVGLLLLVSWIFGLLGGNAMYARQQEAHVIYAITQENPNTAPDQDFVNETIDLSQRAPAYTLRSDGRLQPPDQYSATYFGKSKPGPGYVAAVYSHKWGNTLHTSGICEQGLDYNTQLGPWGSRGKDSARRKSARMLLAYERGVIMTSSLRRLLVIMKQFPDAVIDVHNSIFVPGTVVSLCLADPTFPGITQEEYDTQVALSNSIDLAGAPRVRVLYFHGAITGMCLIDQCGENTPSEDLTYKVTWMGDLLDEDPPLSEGQAAAVKALEYVGTDAFWLQAAHRNGIYDDAKLLRLKGYAEVYRDRVLHGK